MRKPPALEGASNRRQVGGGLRISRFLCYANHPWNQEG